VNWSTWTDYRGGATLRRRFPKTAPWTLPNSSSGAGRAKPKKATLSPKNRGSRKLPWTKGFLEKRRVPPSCEPWNKQKQQLQGVGDRKHSMPLTLS
jgi:hypothetical protein